MGFTFKDINGEIYELPYEANENYIELSCKRDNDNKNSVYYVKIDEKTININEETYLAIEKYKNNLK